MKTRQTGKQIGNSEVTVGETASKVKKSKHRLQYHTLHNLVSLHFDESRNDVSKTKRQLLIIATELVYKKRILDPEGRFKFKSRYLQQSTMGEIITPIEHTEDKLVPSDDQNCNGISIPCNVGKTRDNASPVLEFQIQGQETENSNVSFSSESCILPILNSNSIASPAKATLTIFEPVSSDSNSNITSINERNTNTKSNANSIQLFEGVPQNDTELCFISPTTVNGQTTATDLHNISLADSSIPNADCIDNACILTTTTEPAHVKIIDSSQQKEVIQNMCELGGMDTDTHIAPQASASQPFCPADVDLDKLKGFLNVPFSENKNSEFREVEIVKMQTSNVHTEVRSGDDVPVNDNIQVRTNTKTKVITAQTVEVVHGDTRGFRLQTEKTKENMNLYTDAVSFDERLNEIKLNETHQGFSKGDECITDDIVADHSSQENFKVSPVSNVSDQRDFEILDHKAELDNTNQLISRYATSCDDEYLSTNSSGDEIVEESVNAVNYSNTKLSNFKSKTLKGTSESTKHMQPEPNVPIRDGNIVNPLRRPKCTTLYDFYGSGNKAEIMTKSPGYTRHSAENVITTNTLLKKRPLQQKENWKSTIYGSGKLNLFAKSNLNLAIDKTTNVTGIDRTHENKSTEDIVIVDEIVNDNINGFLATNKSNNQDIKCTKPNIDLMPIVETTITRLSSEQVESIRIAYLNRNQDDLLKELTNANCTVVHANKDFQVGEYISYLKGRPVTDAQYSRYPPNTRSNCVFLGPRETSPYFHLKDPTWLGNKILKSKRNPNCSIIKVNPGLGSAPVFCLFAKEFISKGTTLKWYH